MPNLKPLVHRSPFLVRICFVCGTGKRRASRPVPLPTQALQKGGVGGHEIFSPNFIAHCIKRHPRFQPCGVYMPPPAACLFQNAGTKARKQTCRDAHENAVFATSQQHSHG